MSRPIGRCIGCFHDFNTGPCSGCGARNARPPLTPADLEPACVLCRRIGGHTPTCLAVLAAEIERGETP